MRSRLKSKLARVPSSDHQTPLYSMRLCWTYFWKAFDKSLVHNIA